MNLFFFKSFLLPFLKVSQFITMHIFLPIFLINDKILHVFYGWAFLTRYNLRISLLYDDDSGSLI